MIASLFLAWCVTGGAVLNNWLTVWLVGGLLSDWVAGWLGVCVVFVVFIYEVCITQALTWLSLIQRSVRLSNPSKSPRN